jgi:hypothetical protein
MKLKSKLKSKLKKLLVVLPVFILVFSFSFSASALKNGSSELIITNSNMWGVGTTTNVSGSNVTTSSGEGVSFQSPFSSGTFILVDLTYNFSDSSTSNPYGEFAIWIYADGATFTTSNDAGVLVNDVYSDDFTVGLSGDHITVYSHGTVSMPTNFKIRFYAYTKNPIEMYYSTSYTYVAFDKSTSDIINNDNQNTDKIIGSLGGSDDYNAPTDGDLGSLEDTEDALVNDNKVQSDEANTRIKDNVLGSIQRFYSAFGATMAMFQDMTVKLPDFSVLIYFSLIMGIVPIIVGLTINNLRGHDAKVARERRRSEYRKGG